MLKKEEKHEKEAQRNPLRYKKYKEEEVIRIAI